MMKFLELAARDNEALADLLAREHGKTVADAKGDIQRGLEVVEFCIGAPQMLKGEYTEALYTRMPDNKWVYIGRYRWDKDRAYFSES
jgi:acyl-CoA reductase-like NAD-dependent aldehyde dehydrogenase